MQINFFKRLGAISGALVLSTYSVLTFAEDSSNGLSLGLKYSLDFQSYKGDKTYSSVLPLFFYDNDRIYMEGGEGGVYLINTDHDELRVNAYYDGNSFDPKKEMRGLDKRKWSVMAGGSYMHITPFGGFKAQIGTDVLSRNKGSVIKLSYLAEIKQNNWSIYPELGMRWNSAKYNQYYFDVSPQEAARTNISAYQAKQSVQPYASTNIDYKVNDHWHLFGGLDFTYLSKTQYDSPIVRSRYDVEPSLGVLYRF